MPRGLRPTELTIRGVPETGERGDHREAFPPVTLSPSQSGGQSEKPSGRGGEGAAFILSSRTRRSLKLESVGKIKGYYSPSRWEIVALMSLWHLTFSKVPSKYRLT